MSQFLLWDTPGTSKNGLILARSLPSSITVTSSFLFQKAMSLSPSCHLLQNSQELQKGLGSTLLSANKWVCHSSTDAGSVESATRPRGKSLFLILIVVGGTRHFIFNVSGCQTLVPNQKFVRNASSQSSPQNYCSRISGNEKRDWHLKFNNSICESDMTATGLRCVCDR